MVVSVVDPNPTYHFDTLMRILILFDADTDPDFYNLTKYRINFLTRNGLCGSGSASPFDADPDPIFIFYGDPACYPDADPRSQNDADSDPQH